MAFRSLNLFAIELLPVLISEWGYKPANLIGAASLKVYTCLFQFFSERCIVTCVKESRHVTTGGPTI